MADNGGDRLEISSLRDELDTLRQDLEAHEEATAGLPERVKCLQERVRTMADEEATGAMSLEAGVLTSTFLAFLVLACVIIARHPGWPELLALISLGLLWLGVVAVVMHYGGKRR